MSCHLVQIGSSVGVICVDDQLAGIDEPEWCPCCGRFGERAQMVRTETEHGVEWWHEDCAAEHSDLLP